MAAQLACFGTSIKLQAQGKLLVVLRCSGRDIVEFTWFYMVTQNDNACSSDILKDWFNMVSAKCLDFKSLETSFLGYSLVRKSVRLWPPP